MGMVDETSMDSVAVMAGVVTVGRVGVPGREEVWVEDSPVAVASAAEVFMAGDSVEVAADGRYQVRPFLISTNLKRMQRCESL